MRDRTTLLPGLDAMRRACGTHTAGEGLSRKGPASGYDSPVNPMTMGPRGGFAALRIRLDGGA
ncbi:hypothetical protein [Methylobacterium sp. ID0610]|uniref:hypothetical protein n=1 Tax=Methylobacterium carpenticola TaxID=3344827 RepID=UPI0036B86F61